MSWILAICGFIKLVIVLPFSIEREEERRVRHDSAKVRRWH